MKGNCHIYSFVERVKLYRFVYESIGTVNDIQEKKSSKVIRGGTLLLLFEKVNE